MMLASAHRSAANATASTEEWEAIDAIYIRGRVGQVEPVAHAHADAVAAGRSLRDGLPIFSLISRGYDVPESRIIGLPNWTRTVFFDINAVAGRQPSFDEHDAYYRGLLEDRFNAIVHTESRELPVYALVLAREDGRLGPGMRRSDVDCGPVIAAALARVEAGERPAPPAPGQRPTCEGLAVRFNPFGEVLSVEKVTGTVPERRRRHLQCTGFGDRALVRMLIAWQLANELKLGAYALIERGPIARHGDLRGQLQRSASNVPPAIAEGFGEVLCRAARPPFPVQNSGGASNQVNKLRVRVDRPVAVCIRNCIYQPPEWENQGRRAGRPTLEAQR